MFRKFVHHQNQILEVTDYQSSQHSASRAPPFVTHIEEELLDEIYALLLTR